METQHTPGPIIGKNIVVRKDNRIVGFWIPSEFKVRKQTISFYDDYDRSIEQILNDTQEWFIKRGAPGHEFSIETIQIQSPLEAAAPELLDELEKANEIIKVMLNALPDNLKPAAAQKIYERGLATDGMTRSNEREAVINKAKGI